ncbi:hypothetical protein ES707_06617 [subsurface metagenome]
MKTGTNVNIWLFAALFFVVYAVPAQAATITVGPGASYDFVTIQAGINAATEHDTVIVAMGTYNESIRFNGTNIILTSTDPNNPEVVESTIIEADYRDRTSVVIFSGNEDAGCELRGFTITDGDVSEEFLYGGGIRGNGTRAVISNCIIAGNYAWVGGGGLYDCDGPISDCVIGGNEARGRGGQTAVGGGLYKCDGPIVNCIIINNEADEGPGGGLNSCHGTISNCTISNNSADAGGGLYNCDGAISNCAITGNSAAFGGGLYNCDGRISECTITGNEADEFQGGGVYWSAATISNCIISNNSAKKSGGGLYACHNRISNCTIADNISTGWNGGGLSKCGAVRNCVIAGNSAGGAGGGLDQCPSISNSIISGNVVVGNGGAMHDCTRVINCTIIGNRANGNGGAISYHGSGATISNCILWDNTATEGEQISLDSYGDSYEVPSTMTVKYSDVQSGSAAVHLTTGCTLNWDPGNIEVEPSFKQPGRWGMNAVWVDGDYHLLPNSLCINAGDPNYIVQANEADLDGNPRIINGIVDMGAYEFQHVPSWYVDALNGNDNNDGLSSETAFATIQKGIDRAGEGNIILVYPGVYREQVNFLGKAITVQSAKDAAMLEAPDNFAVSFYMGEGHNSVLKNFIIRNSYMAIFIAHSSPAISNLTIVNNRYGIEAYAGVEPDISNSIFWNNTDGNLFGCQARYSCVEQEGEGNINTEPLFVDPNNDDYHLRSERGRYWPEHDVWVLDEVTSPCIDHGDPTVDPSREPTPNGGRINMGAYGGTAYASMSEMRWIDGDINHDGIVNMIDLALLAENWLQLRLNSQTSPHE